MWNSLAKISPFSRWICLRDLQETDTADHRENSHKQLFMHSVTVSSKQPVKDAVTGPPALPGEELRSPAPNHQAHFQAPLQGWSGWWLRPQELLPAWPWHWGTEEPDFSPAVPIFVATWEHHRLQLLVQDSLIFSMLFKMKSSLILNNLSTSEGTTLRTLMASLFPCPSVEKMTGGQAYSSILVDLFAVSLFGEGFPAAVLSLCRWAKRRRAVLPKGMPAGFDQTAQIPGSFFSHSC